MSLCCIRSRNVDLLKIGWSRHKKIRVYGKYLNSKVTSLNCRKVDLKEVMAEFASANSRILDNDALS
jgi:hypothetical protein